jgi:spermidine/putrescine transport system permease protein
MFSIKLNLITLTIAHTILGMGFMIPVVYNRFKNIDKRLIEASLDLGASKNKTFFKIILPLVKPSITASSLLVFILSFDDFLLSFFCSGSESQTLSLYIFSMLKTGISPIVNALSTILLTLSSFLVLLFCKMNNNDIF